MKRSKKAQQAKIIQFEPAGGHELRGSHRRLARMYLESLRELDQLLSERKKSSGLYPTHVSGSKR